MDIIEATRGFEWWLRRKIPVVEADLAYKHEQMRADPFLFFRATFYRWAQLWPRLCPQLAKTHVVQTVGDLHLENFGTWRDEEGRLVWGVNDFDEAYPMAFANDLVRLATSALIASQDQSRIELRPNDIFEKLVEGYQASISAGGEPLILMEKHPKLREMATQQLRQPSEFWQRFEAKTEGLAHDLPDGLRRAFVKLLPDDAKPSYRVVKTPKGLGSLGRRRYLAEGRRALGVPLGGGEKDRRGKSLAGTNSRCRCALRRSPLSRQGAVAGASTRARLQPDRSRGTEASQGLRLVALFHGMGNR
jgi:hypothetical protein